MQPDKNNLVKTNKASSLFLFFVSILLSVEIFISVSYSAKYFACRNDESFAIKLSKHYLSSGDAAEAMKWDREIDAAKRGGLAGLLWIGIFIFNIVIFAVGVGVRCKAARPTTIRVASFLILSMVFGFLIFVATAISLVTFLMMLPDH